MADRQDCLTVDCGRPAVPPPPARVSYAGVDYMARDFDSLLRALLDQLSRLAPEWRDRSEADLGMVLLELFAYAGDHASYLDERVTLEGFLRTATQADSVRRLLRLIDYRMDPGQAAEAELVVACEGPVPLFLPSGFGVWTNDPPQREAVRYETVEDAVLHPVLSVIGLAADAPSSADGREAVLAADLTGAIGPGTWLLFQQGDRREWARVSAVAPGATTTVTVAAALGARYSAAGDPALGIPRATVHGNRVRATHGTSHVARQAGTGMPRQFVALDEAPITWVRPNDASPPETTLRIAVDGEEWLEVDDFVDSDAAAPHYRLSNDNAGYITVHFGDGVAGRVPERGSDITVRCRIGIGQIGHVARDALTEFDRQYRFADPLQKLLAVRNPFPARSPRDPQSMAQAKLLGPAQLRVQNRAVVPDDFARALARGVWINGTHVVPRQTHTHVRHTGSWNTIVVSVDMPDRRPLTRQQRTAFEARLGRLKVAGHDVRVETARYCPVHVGLRIEVEPEHFARDVRRAVERALIGPAGGQAFFEPGRFDFGDPVFLSDLYAAVTAVEGVHAAAVTRFKRLGDRYPDREAAGFIEVGALEIARCDNDPAAPENGLVFVKTCGGKEG